jgi:hypothetical protein
MDEYITLAEAATYAGYRSKSTLKTAAGKGHLKTIKPAPNFRMTTRAWVDEYLASQRGGQYRRGQERGPRSKPQDAGDGAGE